MVALLLPWQAFTMAFTHPGSAGSVRYAASDSLSPKPEER